MKTILSVTLKKGRTRTVAVQKQSVSENVFHGTMHLLRPIYTVRFLLTIVACDFCSARCSRHGKIVYDFHDTKLPVATIVVGF